MFDKLTIERYNMEYKIPTQEDANEYLKWHGPWDMAKHFGITKYDANRLIMTWFNLKDDDLEFPTKESE